MRPILSPQMSPPEKSPWHSPVPYLFGGLAAMLGLIAFALLILACSYWSLSNRPEEESEERDLENGEKDGNDVVKQPKVFEEKFLVIMAGMDKPTFLATPVMTTKVCSCDQQKDETEMDGGLEKVESEEKSKTEGEEETEDHHHEQN